MNKKQQVIRWMKYHGGSTIALILLIVIARMGGFNMGRSLIVLSIIITAVLLFSIEHIFWKVVVQIMGKQFVANLLDDPWIMGK